MSSNLKLCIFAATVALIVLFGELSEAQTVWQGFNGKSSATMNCRSLHFKSEDDWKASGRLLALDMTIRRTDKGSLVINVPFAIYTESIKSPYPWAESHDTQGLFGNPYFGGRILSPKPFVSFAFGLRLPLTVDSELDAAVSGMFADIDRVEAFIHNHVPINLGISFDMKSSEGILTRLTIAPNYWIYIGKSKDVNIAEFVLHYGGITGFENQDIRLQAGISGLAILSEKNAFTNETSLHQFGVELNLRMGNIWPGFQLRLPLNDDVNDIIDYVWGISIMYEE